MSKVIDEADLRDILHIQKETHGRKPQYVCNCPFCGKESHFYVNKITQKFQCKKCWEQGEITKLLRFLGKTYLLEGATIQEDQELTSIRSIISEKHEEEVKLPDLPTVKMPIGWKVCNRSIPYLINRHVDGEICVRYNIGITNLLLRFKDYVLIPIYDNGEIKGYIGRYAAKKVPENKLRYNNSLGTEFAQLLFGYDEIVKDETETVILVEGVFDKISVDRHLGLWEDNKIKCVCTFGKKISEYQIEKLKRKNVAKVILLFDYDALSEIKKYGILLSEYFITGITFTNKKDIDECTTEEALEVFSNIRKPYEFNTDIIGKLKR